MSKPWFHDYDDPQCPANLSDYNECVCTVRSMTFEGIKERHDSYQKTFEKHGLKCNSQKHMDRGRLIEIIEDMQ